MAATPDDQRMHTFQVRLGHPGLWRSLGYTTTAAASLVLAVALLGSWPMPVVGTVGVIASVLAVVTSIGVLIARRSAWDGVGVGVMILVAAFGGSAVAAACGTAALGGTPCF